ncbi:hypothetical protein FHU13_002208 [Methylobacterium sp. R2-1]|nr:hypothetical protein [Methylobacterium sp. R2-1]
MGTTKKSPRIPQLPHLQITGEANRPLLSGGIRAELPPVPIPVRESNGRFRRGAPSPNPSGRAPIAPEVKEAARVHTTAMLAVLVEVAMDGAAPPAARVAAANAVLDRGHGKPMANLQAKVANVDLGAMHLAALKELSLNPTARTQPE